MSWTKTATSVRIVGLEVDRERVVQPLGEGFQDLVVDMADIGLDAGRGHRVLEPAIGRERDVEIGAALRALDEGVAGLAASGASSIVSASSATSPATPNASHRVTVSQWRL